MKLWGHTFTDFKSCERICWTCGYVIDRDSSEREVRRWIKQEEGGELHCGGRWGHYRIGKATAINNLR